MLNQYVAYSALPKKYLKASEQYTVILDGKEEYGLFLIQSDSVTIDGFVIKNVGTSYIEDRAAIMVEKSENSKIVNNILENTFFGIYFKKSSNCEISGNMIAGKAVKEFSNEHIAQILNYLKLADSDLGLLVNFQNKSLEYKRYKL